MIKRVLAAIVFLVCLSTNIISAQTAGYREILERNSFRKSLNDGLSKINSIRYDFNQKKQLSLLDEAIVSKGIVIIKKPGQLRFEYLDPYKYLLVMKNGEVIVSTRNKTSSFNTKNNKFYRLLSSVMFDCMNGSALDNDQFKSTVYFNGSTYLLSLVPNKPELKSLFDSVSVYLQSSDFTVSMLVLKEVSGDVTTIYFKLKSINANVQDTDFRLD